MFRKRTAVNARNFRLALGICVGRVLAHYGVEPDHFGFRVEPLGQDGENRGAAAYVENSLIRADVRVIDQGSHDSFADKPAVERVVEREKPIVAGRGDVASVTHLSAQSRA